MLATKIQNLKKRKKLLEISSFYIYVPKIMARWSTVPEIWCATDGQTDRQMEKVNIEVGAIVCIKVLTPPQKHCPLLSCQVPPTLNLQTVKAPLFRQFPPLYIGFSFTAPLKKVTPSFSPTPPLKIKVLSSLLFENLVRGSTPPCKKGRGVHTVGAPPKNSFKRK